MVVTTQSTYAFFDVGEKINNWIENEVNEWLTESIKWIRSSLADPYYKEHPDIIHKWLIILKGLAWVLFSWMVVSRLGVNMGSPFVTGRLHFEEKNLLLTGIGGGLMIYAGTDIIDMIQQMANYFTIQLGNVDFEVPVGTDDFKDAGYQLLGFLLLGILSIIWVVLYGIYLICDAMIDFLTVTSPLVGASIPYTDRFFRLWINLTFGFVIIKPIHMLGISFFFDYTVSMGNPFDKVLLSLFTFIIILALPVIIIGFGVKQIISLGRG